jgi:UPF0716 family protein affecting phage T7 exclusion
VASAWFSFHAVSVFVFVFVVLSMWLGCACLCLLVSSSFYFGVVLCFQAPNEVVWSLYTQFITFLVVEGVRGNLS